VQHTTGHARQLKTHVALAVANDQALIVSSIRVFNESALGANALRPTLAVTPRLQ
jgi:hypothetical protein